MEEPVPADPQDFLEAKEIRFRCLLVSIHVTAYKILLISTVFFLPLKNRFLEFSWLIHPFICFSLSLFLEDANFSSVLCKFLCNKVYIAM